MAKSSPASKILFAAVLALIGWVLLEASVSILFRAVHGVALPRAAERARLRSIAAAPRTTSPSTTPSTEPPGADELFEGVVIHPYMGFAEDLSASERVTRPLLGWTRDELSRSDERLVVGIFGGSMARWMVRDASATLQRALEAATGRSVALRSFAWGGVKQPQQLLTLTYLLSMGAEFDIVINLDGFNEVALPATENRPAGIFGNYPRSWMLLAGGLESPASLRRIGRIDIAREQRRDWARRFEDLGLDASNIGLLLWRARDARLEQRITALESALVRSNADAASYRVTGPRVASADEGNDRADDDDYFDTLVTWWHDSSLQMHRLSAANQIRYLHFLQPNQYVAGSKPMGAEERAIAIDPDHIYRDAAIAGYPRLIASGAALAREGVAFHDLTRAFADEPAPLYGDSCCHLNLEGSQRIARLIADRVALDGPAH